MRACAVPWRPATAHGNARESAATPGNPCGLCVRGCGLRARDAERPHRDGDAAEHGCTRRPTGNGQHAARATPDAACAHSRQPPSPSPTALPPRARCSLAAIRGGATHASTRGGTRRPSRRRRRHMAVAPRLRPPTHLRVCGRGRGHRVGSHLVGVEDAYDLVRSRRVRPHKISPRKASASDGAPFPFWRAKAGGLASSSPAKSNER